VYFALKLQEGPKNKTETKNVEGTDLTKEGVPDKNQGNDEGEGERTAMMSGKRDLLQ
jgi:hypothetical protein